MFAPVWTRRDIIEVVNEGVRRDRLEALMAARGYGPGELAYQAGVSYNYIYKIRLGQAPHISAAQVAKLAAALRTSPGYLMGSTDDPAPQPVPSTQLVVNEDRADYAPLTREVAQLAARLNRLPAGARAKIIAAFAAVVELTEGQPLAVAEALNAPAGEDQAATDARLADQRRRLFRLLDQLTDEEVEEWTRRIQAAAAAEQRAAAQTG
jgi:transcriptional regulator with XRE-family HTH domain